MNTLYRLILSAILAAAATALIQKAAAGETVQELNQTMLAGIIFISCAVCALVSPSLSSIARASSSTSNPAVKTKRKSPAKGREQGQVKWFNVSKGYGFVTRSSGEEIFVHFRSIRGSGRKVLRDGQQVEFTVSTGDKGPQAEDVETIG